MPSFYLRESTIREQIRPTSDAASDVDMPFIDLIICPSYDVSYKTENLERYGIDKMKYMEDGDYVPKKNMNESETLQDIFHSITYEVEDLLYGVTISTLDRENLKYKLNFNGSNTYDNGIVDVVTKYWKSYGRCYSIRPTNKLIAFGVDSIVFKARMNIYVYFGHPGQFMYVTKTKVTSNLLS